MASNSWPAAPGEQEEAQHVVDQEDLPGPRARADASLGGMRERQDGGVERQRRAAWPSVRPLDHQRDLMVSAQECHKKLRGVVALVGSRWVGL